MLRFRSIWRSASLPSSRSFTVLAFESSADDTCAAVVDSAGTILSNIVIKQNHLHQQYGGIRPIPAIHAHQQNMPHALRMALDEANVDIVKDIDGIAATRGPGMHGCLSVGMITAKSLASALNKPFVGVHHMQAHALTPLLSCPHDSIKFPFVTLLISGGHTMLVLATSFKSFRILATSNDLSVGQCFDQVSKMLGLTWTKLGPGDALEKFCAGDPDAKLPSIPDLPRPVLGRMEFSYSGIFSQVERFVHQHGGVNNMNIPLRRALARGFQMAAVRHLEDKLILALKWCRDNSIDIQNVAVSGGVASNMYLRERLSQCVANADLSKEIQLMFPPPHLCTDNAAMIAWASMRRFLDQDYDDYGVDVLSKWSIEEVDG